MNLVNYIGNLGKSVAYASVDKFKAMSPTTTEFITTNQELYKSVYENIRDYRTTYRRTNNYLKSSKVYEAGNVYFKALMEDITTGKFYNKERQAQMDAKAVGFDENGGGSDDWGSFSMGDDSEFGSFNLDDNNDEDFGSFSAGDEMVAGAIRKSSEANANAVSMAIARTGQYVVESNKIQNNLMITQQIQAFGNINNGLNSINENIGKMLEFSNEVLKTHVTNSTSFYDNATKQLQEQTVYLKQIAESLAPKKEEKKEKEKITFEDLIGSEGAVDLKAYMNLVKKNGKNMISQLMPGGMDFGGNGNTLLSLVAQPLQFIPTMVVSALVPKMVEKAVTDFDKSLSGFFGSAMMKINSTKNSDNPLLQKIGQLFGVNNSLKGDIDTSQYEKGKVDWDGKSKKALEEVIPAHLARIESLLSGQSERRYDFDRGKFVDGKSIKKSLEDKKKSYSKKATSEMYDQFQQYMDMLTFNSKSDKENLDKDIQKIFDYMYKNAEIFDVNNKNFDDLAYKYGVDTKSLRIFRSLFRHAPRNMRLGINREIMRTRQAQTNELNQLEKNGSIYSQLFNGLPIDEFIKENKTTGEKKSLGLFGKDNLNDTKDNLGHNIFYYLQKITENTYNNGGNQRRNNGGLGMPGAPSGPTEIIGPDGTRRRINPRSPYTVPDDSKKTEAQKASEKRYREERSFKNKEEQRRKKNKDLINVSEFDDDPRKLDALFESKMQGHDIENNIKAQREKRDSIFDDLIGKSALEKWQMIKDKGAKFIDKPMKFIASAFQKADQHLYEAIYGSDDGEVRGFMDLLVTNTKKTFSRLNSWIDDNVLEPIKKKLEVENFKDLGKKFFGMFGLDLDDIGKRIKTYFFGDKDSGEKGLFSDITDGFKNTFKSAFGYVKNSVTGTFRDITKPFKDKFKNSKRAFKEAEENETEDDITLGEEKDFTTRNYIESNIMQTGYQSSGMTADDYSNLFSETLDQEDFDNYDLNATSPYEQKKKIFNKIKDLLKYKEKLNMDLQTLPDGISWNRQRNTLKDKIKRVDKKIAKLKDKLNRIKSQGRRSNYQINEAIANRRGNDARANRQSELDYTSDRINDLFKLAGIETSDKNKQQILNVLTGNRRDIDEYSIDDIINSANSLYGNKFSNIEYKQIKDKLEAYKNGAITSDRSKNINDIIQNKYGIINDGSSSLEDLERRFSGLISGDLDTRYGNVSTEAQLQSADYLKDIRDFLLSLRPQAPTRTQQNGIDITANNPDRIPSEDGVLRSTANNLANVIYNFLQGNTASHAEGSNVLKEPELTTLNEGEVVFNEQQTRAVSSLVDVVMEALGTAGNKLSDVAAGSYKKFNRVKDLLGDKLDLNNLDEVSKYASDDVKQKFGKVVDIEQYKKVMGLMTKQRQIDNDVDENGNPLDPIQRELMKNIKPFSQEMISELKKGVKAAKISLFGISAEDEKDRFSNAMKDVSENISEYAPKMLPAAVLGSGVSLITGAIGGPLLGAAVGAGTSLAMNSEKVQTWLFGDKVADERTGGVIPKPVIDAVQKYLPDAGKFGTFGALAGLFTPLGLVGGLSVGAGASFVKNNEKVQEFLFGEKGLFDEKAKEKLKKALPRVGLGVLAGSVFGPFGLVTNAVLGGAAGFATTSNKFTDMILGVKNEETGEYESGILPTLREKFVLPLTTFADDMKTKLTHFLENDVLDPLKRAFQPLKRQGRIVLNGLAKLVGKGIDTLFEHSFGTPLSKLAEKFTSKISNGIKNIGKGVLWGAKNAVKGAFGLVGLSGDALTRHQIATGNAYDLTAEQRLAQMNGRDYKFRTLDQALVNGNLEGNEAAMNSIKQIMDLGKSSKQKRKDLANETGSELAKYLNYNDTHNVMKAFRDGDNDAINNIISKSTANKRASIDKVNEKVLKYYQKGMDKINSKAQARGWNDKDIKYATVKLKDEIKSKFLKDFDVRTQKEILDRLDDESKFTKFMDMKRASLDSETSKLKDFISGKQTEFDTFNTNKQNSAQVKENLRKELLARGINIDVNNKDELDKVYQMFSTEVNRQKKQQNTTNNNKDNDEVTIPTDETLERRHSEIVNLFGEAIKVLKQLNGEEETTNPVVANNPEATINNIVNDNQDKDESNNTVIGRTNEDGILTHIDNNGQVIQYRREQNGDLAPNLSDSGTRQALRHNAEQQNEQKGFLANLKEKFGFGKKKNDEDKEKKGGILSSIKDFLSNGGILKTLAMVFGGGFLLKKLAESGMLKDLISGGAKLLGDIISGAAPAIISSLGTIVTDGIIPGVKEILFPQSNEEYQNKVGVEETDKSYFSNPIVRDVIKGGKGMEKLAQKTAFNGGKKGIFGAILHPFRTVTKATVHTGSKIGSWIGKGVEKLNSPINNSKVLTSLRNKIQDKTTSKFFTETSETVAKKVGKETAETAVTKFEAKLTQLLTEVLSSKGVKALLGETSETLITDFVPKFAEKAAKKAATTATKSAAKLAAVASTGGLAAAAFAVTDFVSGYNDACNILNITPEKLDEMGMYPKVITGLTKMIIGLLGNLCILLAFIPEEWVAPTIVELVAPLFGMDKETLNKKQEETKQEIDNYNKQNGTNLDTRTYNHDVKGHKTMGEKFGFSFKDIKDNKGFLSHSLRSTMDLTGENAIRAGGDFLGILGFDGAAQKVDEAANWYRDKKQGVKDWFVNLFNNSSNKDTESNTDSGEGGPYENTIEDKTPEIVQDNIYNGLGGSDNINSEETNPIDTIINKLSSINDTLNNNFSTFMTWIDENIVKNVQKNYKQAVLTGKANSSDNNTSSSSTTSSPMTSFKNLVGAGAAKLGQFATNMVNKITGKGGPYTGIGGGEINGIPTGTEPLSEDVQKYSSVFESAGQQFNIDPNWIKAIAMQESGGNVNSDNGAALGIMQIEKGGTTDEFIQYGRQLGESWTPDDRRDPNKAIPFGASRLADLIQHYNGDYTKATQAYNFSKYSLDPLIKAFPNDWMDHRAEVGQYNGTGLSSYGDPEYVEHVFRYYNGDGSFSGSGTSSNSSNSSSENKSGGFFSDLQNLMTNSVGKFFGIQLNGDSSSSSDGGSGSSANVVNDQVDTSSLSGDVKKVVDFAASKIGCPYVWGGEGAPLTEQIVAQYRGTSHDITSNDGANGGYQAWLGKEGYDCSGLMQAAYNSIGKDIGRDTNAQLASPNGTEVSVSEVQPGDLVFFGSRSNNHHVGMAIGNGKMIEAPSSGKTVRVADIRQDAFAAKRFLNGGSGGPYSKLTDRRTKVKAKCSKIVQNAIGGPADTFFSKTLNGNVTSNFGFRNTRGSIGRNHTGIDIGAKQGQDIKSPIGGQVVGKVPSEKSNGYGNLLQVQDDNGAIHYFGHMENPSNLKPGDKVKPGDKLGNVGNTGNSTGSHLHYEVKENGISVDPNKYLAKKGIGGPEEKVSNNTLGIDTTQLLQSIIKILSTIAQNTVSISDIVTILKAMNPNTNNTNNSEQSTAVIKQKYQNTQDQLTKILQKNNKDKNATTDQDLLNILNSLAKL